MADSSSSRFRQLVDGGGWTTIQDAAGTSKSVTAAAEGTRQYQVRACSGAGCSGYSSSATVAVVMPPATTGAKPGAIPGAFSVGTQGEASYSIPITVPAGTGGLKPSVALSYNHLAGNGLAGMRWTLSGISAISLCLPTFAQDGPVPSTGALCLNGQRLVNLDPEHHAYLDADTEYRTEIESFQRIKQQGTGTSASFYVDHGNGQRSYFGESSSSRVVADGIVRTWYISRTVDQFGNTIAYGYDQSTADGTLPKTITWTGNTVVEPALPPRYTLTINYETRPTDDQRSGYGIVGPWVRTQRIHDIAVTYNHGTPQSIATYALTYASTTPPYGTGRSQLASVSVCRGSECLPATSFTNQSGASSWGAAQSTNRSAGAYPQPGDWNGDGRMDLFVSLSNHWQVYPGKADGLFDTTVDTGLASTTNPDKARVFDFNGDGRADLLYQDGSSNWKIAPSNGSSGFGTSIDSGVSTSLASPILQDHDGDGLPDLIYATSGGVAWRRNLSASSGTFASAATLYTPEGLGSVQSFSTVTLDSPLTSLDANGDGRADLIALFVDQICNPNNPYDCYEKNVYELLIANGTSYYPIEIDNLLSGHYDTNFRAGDFNGDGLSDILYINQDGQWTLRYSVGTDLGLGNAYSVPTTSAAKVMIADYDGDGRDDLLRPDGIYWRIHRSTGTTLPGAYTDSLAGGASASVVAFVADVAGSGYPEIVATDGSGWYVHPRVSTLKDVATAFTDGLGRVVSVQYASLAQTSAYTLDPSHAPGESYVRRYGGARYVVTTETHDNGIGGTRDFLHTYDTAFVNIAGRGWLAFYQHAVKDVLQDTYTLTTYNQTFPTAGMPEFVKTATVGSDHLIDTSDDGVIRTVDPEPAATAITGTTPNRQFVRVEQTTTEEREVGGANDGDLLRTVVEDPVYHSTYGYVTETTRTVTQPGVSGAWVTKTDFGPGVNDFDNPYLLCRGLPGSVVTRNSVPGGSLVPRTVEYFYSECTLESVTDLSEPVDTSQQLRRELEHDGFGNVVSVSEFAVGAPSQARVTTIDYDDDGQFPDSVTVGGVSLTTSFDFDPLSGLKTSVTGPDGLSTSYVYDAFGRLTRETRPAAPADAVGHVDVSYHVCASGGCFAPRAAFYVKSADTSGATSYTFLDAFERPVGSDAPLAGSRRSRTKTEYQASGRVDRRSLPYVAGEETEPGIHWVTMDYDDIGRPLSETDESMAGTTYSYLGHELAVEDGNSHTTHFVHNALGQIEEVEDAAGGTTAYTYYPFGELHTVTDNDANVTMLEYDARGFKTDMDDPDMGHWTYDYNAFGELVSQTDAKSQTVTLAYDAAGRLETRDDGGTDNVTTWEYYPYDYGTAGHAGHLKKVTSADELASVGDLTEQYVYNASHGAVASITRSIGGSSYVFDYTYDTEGRLSQLTYPTNARSQRLGVEYLYDGSSVLSQVRNATTTSTVYYALNAQEASGAVRKATLGNGIVEQYGYEPETGQLATIKAGLGGSAALQNVELEWDLAGNLATRRVRDGSHTLLDTDVFAYDALDRLLSQTRDSTPIFGVTYDTGKLGNIATKTGVTGTYGYGAGSAGPHAVTSIGSSMTFSYDANGNMTNRNGDTIAWTRYNLPSRIDGAGTAYSEFLYGGDRSRYVQVEDDGSSTHTRHYAAAGLFEAVYTGSTRVDHQYVQANGHAVAEITTTSSADDTQYLHRDQQGSVVATTNTSGTLLEQFEYDPFGVSTVGDDEDHHRGYTGHEHLPALGLVHMNGRIQDPLIGRFLSADPTVQAPYYSQSLNRYSYVWNNPVSLLDPSGFQTECPDGNEKYCGDKCRFDSGADGCIPQVCIGMRCPGQETIPGEEPPEERSGIWCIWSCTRMDGAGVPDTGGFTFAVGDGSALGSLSSAFGEFQQGAWSTVGNAGWDLLQLHIPSLVQTWPIDDAPPPFEVPDTLAGQAGAFAGNVLLAALPMLAGKSGAARALPEVVPAARGARFVDEVVPGFGRGSAGAGQVVRTLQTGGNKMLQQTADALNASLGQSLGRRDWGRALEGLKRELGLPGDHHGQIRSTGEYVDDAGKVLGNLLDYVP